MSPRRRTVGPGRPPSMTATTELSAAPGPTLEPELRQLLQDDRLRLRQVEPDLGLAMDPPPDRDDVGLDRPAAARRSATWRSWRSRRSSSWPARMARRSSSSEVSPRGRTNQPRTSGARLVVPDGCTAVNAFVEAVPMRCARDRVRPVESTQPTQVLDGPRTRSRDCGSRGPSERHPDRPRPRHPSRRNIDGSGTPSTTKSSKDWPHRLGTADRGGQRSSGGRAQRHRREQRRSQPAATAAAPNGWDNAGERPERLRRRPGRDDDGQQRRPGLPRTSGSRSRPDRSSTASPSASRRPRPDPSGCQLGVSLSGNGGSTSDQPQDRRP